MRYIIFSLALFALTMAATTTVHAKIYKWIDENGNVHMSDKPPKTGGFDEVKVEVNVISAQRLLPKDNPSIPNKEKAVASNKKVIMYGAEWCGVCKKAKRYFKKNNIPFTEYDIDKSAKGRRDYEKLGGGGIPIILVGTERMSGFSASSFQRLYQQP